MTSLFEFTYRYSFEGGSRPKWTVIWFWHDWKLDRPVWLNTDNIHAIFNFQIVLMLNFPKHDIFEILFECVVTNNIILWLYYMFEIWILIIIFISWRFLGIVDIGYLKLQISLFPSCMWTKIISNKVIRGHELIYLVSSASRGKSSQIWAKIRLSCIIGIWEFHVRESTPFPYP